jgi:hypothetical protein
MLKAGPSLVVHEVYNVKKAINSRQTHIDDFFLRPPLFRCKDTLVDATIVLYILRIFGITIFSSILVYFREGWIMLMRS